VTVQSMCLRFISFGQNQPRFSRLLKLTHYTKLHISRVVGSGTRWTQLQTEISTRSIPMDKEWPARNADNLFDIYQPLFS
jgi:hypothetical protein